MVFLPHHGLIDFIWHRPRKFHPNPRTTLSVECVKHAAIVGPTGRTGCGRTGHICQSNQCSLPADWPPFLLSMVES